MAEKKTSDRRVRKTKKALTNGFCVLLAEKSIQNISVRELTDLVDLNRATFYLHYKDIYDLQEQLEKDCIEEIKTILENYLPQNQNDTPRQLFFVVLQHIKENETLYSVLLSENGNRNFLNNLSQLIEKYCYIRFDALFEKGLPPHKKIYASAFLVGGYVSIIERWLTGGMVEEPDELATIMEGIVFNGLIHPRDRSIRMVRENI